MNTTLSKVLIFAAGAVIGSVVTYKLTEKKFKDEYEERLAKDTADVKESFSQAQADYDELLSMFPKKEEAVQIDKEVSRNPISYNDMVSKLGYVEEASEVTTEKKAITMEEVERPEVIDPRDFGEYSDYETVTLYYYTDDVLADDMDNVVDDVEDIVGSYALTTFGQFEDDAVHVRNDRKRCYYEILRSECAYSEKYGQNLYKKED